VSTLNNKDARGSHFTDASKASVIRRARVCGSAAWSDGPRFGYVPPDIMLTNVVFGVRDLRTAYATLFLGDTLVSFECPRAGRPLRYLRRP